jgi:hypothetical protein
MNPIQIEAKTDRELLIMGIDKLNSIEAKLDGVCGQVKINTPRITALEDEMKDTKITMKALIGSIVIIVSGVVYYVLRHIGFPTNP